MKGADIVIVEEFLALKYIWKADVCVMQKDRFIVKGQNCVLERGRGGWVGKGESVPLLKLMLDLEM